MNIKEALRHIFNLFCMTATLFFFALGILAVFLNPDLTFGGKDIFKALFMAFANTLPILVFWRSENVSRKELIIRKAIHFLLSAGIVFGCLTYFGWMNMANALYVVLAFLVLYVVGYIIMEIRERKLADKLNERINAFHEIENETH